MYAQVGYQSTGAHKHIARALVARIKQTLPQHGRGNFNDMKAWLQGNAQHLKGALASAAGGQGNGGAGLRAFEHRNHARFYFFVVNAPSAFFIFAAFGWGRYGCGQFAYAHGFGIGTRNGVIAQAHHVLVPADDFCISLWREVAHCAARNQAFGLQRRFDFAQGYGQQCRPFWAFGKTLDHAKGRGSKLDQWRHGAGTHSQRKAAGIAQRAARVIDQTCGQNNLHGSLLGQVARKTHRFGAA